MTPEQYQNYLQWRNTTLAQAEAANYANPLDLTAGAITYSPEWGMTYGGPEGPSDVVTNTWDPSLYSPLSKAQFDAAMQYTQQSPEEDFVDFMGRVISAGTKINVNDPTTGQSLGYYQYAPKVNEYEAMTPGDRILAGDSAVNLSPNNYVAYVDPSYYNDYSGIYNEWAWNPAEGVTTPRSQADLYDAIRGAGIAPYEAWSGTIGPGGWSAIRGLTGTLLGPAIGALATPTSEAAMVGLSEATGLAPGTAETIVNAAQGAGMGAIKGAMGGNPLSGALTGAVGSGVTSETGSAALGQVAGGLTSAGLNYLNQPSAQTSSGSLASATRPNISTVQPSAGSAARPVTYITYGSPVGYGASNYQPNQTLAAAANSPVGYGASNYLR